MKKELFYCCESCGLNFKTEESCSEHEQNCWKRYSKVKSFSCLLRLDREGGGFSHHVNEYSKAVVKDGVAALFEESVNVKLNSLSLDVTKNSIGASFFTDRFFSEQDQEDIFKKLHEIVFNEVEKYFNGLKELINSKEFIELKTSSNGTFEELKCKKIDY